MKYGPWLIFALALYVRTAGLSHDWDAGMIYHPDTAKQIHATERFVEGDLKLHLHWEVPRLVPALQRHQVRILLRQDPAEAGEPLEYWEEDLVAFLNIPGREDVLHPQWIRIPLPESLSAGRYWIEVQLLVRSEHRWIRVQTSDRETTDRGILLTAIDIGSK